MKRLVITSGRGPAECRIALSKALAVMRTEAEGLGLSADVVEGPAPDARGPGSALVIIDGDDDGTAAFVQRWAGSVLWVAQSPVRPHHRRKNWFVGVSELAPGRGGAGGSELRAGEVRFEAFRAGGAGGQHQNTTDSAVRATHVPSGLAVVAREERSQHRNKAVALRRLAALIAAQEDLAREAEKSERHAQHDQLERGRPVRRFVGPEFREA